MKKILIEGMTSNLGGIETFIKLLYCVLKDEWLIDFIVTDKTIPFEAEFLNSGSKIHRITPRNESIKLYRSDIDHVFERNKYDVFWFNKTTLSSIYTIKSAKQHGVSKVICHSHQSKNMGNFLTLCMHNFNRLRVNRYIDYKAACSKVAADWFFGTNAMNVHIFPNAVDISKYEPNLEKQEEVKTSLGLEGKFVVGHAGRFAPEKNHKFLIEIFIKVLEKKDAHLVLCGEGPLMNEVKSLVNSKGIEDKVSFLGLRKDMPDLFQAMDVFVMPSLFEGLPFVLVEAQASGIPCIVSNTVSSEAKLTDILEYVNLEANPEIWAQKIVAYFTYNKVSKKEQLDEKGFLIDSFARRVNEIVQ